MKIVARNTIKYNGAYIPPETEIDVKKDVAEYLVEQGAADMFVRQTRTAAPEGKAPEGKAPETPEETTGAAEDGIIESPIAG